MATRTWRGTVNSNWGVAGNWLEGAVPTSSDQVIFDIDSPNCILNVAAVCATFNGTGSTAQLTLNNYLAVATNFTLGAGMSTTGTAQLIKTGNGGTLISNGVTWSGSLIFSGAGGAASTWGDDWTILGNLTTNINSQNVNGPYSVTLGGSFSLNGHITANISPFTVIMNGTGTLNGTMTGPRITINTTGTITLTTGLSLTNSRLIYIAGTVVVNPGHTLGIQTTVVLDTDKTSTGGGKIEFANIQVGVLGTQTATLLSDLTLTGNFSTYTTPIAINGFKMYVGRNISPSGGGNITGTTVIEMYGPSNAVLATVGTLLANTLIINKDPAAVVTFGSGSIGYGASGRSLTYLSGIVNPSTSTFVIAAGVTLNTEGMDFYNVTFSTGTLTLNSHLNILNTLLLGLSGNVAFSGTEGWTCASLICTTPGRGITLAAAVTYRTTAAAYLSGVNITPSTSRITLTSDSATIQAIWVLEPGAFQALIYVSGVRIDSSAGQTIWTFSGSMNGTTNWNEGTSPAPVRTTVAHTWIA